MRVRKRVARALVGWIIPAVYAAAALAAGLTLPRFESRLFPGLVANFSVSAATAIYSSIASGMIALTGIVFSLTFVMVQFSATAYSPRLVLWIARDRAMMHALGVFTATFLYAIAALAGVDRGGSGTVPFVSAWVSVALLIASTAMFIVADSPHRPAPDQPDARVHGGPGRKVIATIYPHLSQRRYARRRARRAFAAGQPDRRSPRGPAGDPGDRRRRRSCGWPARPAGSSSWRRRSATPWWSRCPCSASAAPARRSTSGSSCDAIDLGAERTFEQDPKYAIRLLVDIAIKALSPAINDPTTAVQALDQIEDLLLRLGNRQLEIGDYRDEDGTVRLVVPFPSWDDLLRLAFDEISFFGATSVQVMRRMNALVADLSAAVPRRSANRGRPIGTSA